MSKSRYIPYSAHRKYVRKLAEGKHRSRQREWLKNILKDIELYEDKHFPHEKFRKTFFQDWYW